MNKPQQQQQHNYHHQSSQKSKKKPKQKRTAVDLEKIIYKQFKTRHSNHKDFYNLQISNQIISNETAHIVALFKDYLILDDISEFLQRYYNLTDSKEKLPKIYDYYSSCSVIFPNYVILHEAKYICKNIQRKQRLIDHQQQYEEDEERRRHELNNLDSSVDTVFNTKTFDSLCNITGSNSIILRAVGDHYAASKRRRKIDNGNTNANLNTIDYSEEISHDKSVERVLELVQRCEDEAQMRRDTVAANRKKNNCNTISIDTESSPLKKSQKFFINNFLMANINASIEKKPKEIKINVKTESNITQRKHKGKISIIGLTQGKGIKKKYEYHKNTLSMPKLSSRIYHVVNKRLYSINTTEGNQATMATATGTATGTTATGNMPCKTKHSLVTSANTNNPNNQTITNSDNSHKAFISLTSRDSDIKARLNIKSDLYELIESKFAKNQQQTLPKKTLGNITTTTTSHLTLKAQHQNQHQHQQHNININTKQQNKSNSKRYSSTQKAHSKSGKRLSSTISSIKPPKGYDNLYDKYQKKSNPSTHRNNRNQMTNNNHYGLFSYDFITTPIVELVKTTRQTTLSNELGKKREKIVKNFCIKGFEEMIRKKENGMGVSNSERERDKDSKPNGMITMTKAKNQKQKEAK